MREKGRVQARKKKPKSKRKSYKKDGNHPKDEWKKLFRERFFV